MLAKITSLRHVRLNSQGYDSDGRYWGNGSPLYRAEIETDNDCWTTETRASDPTEALVAIANKLRYSTRFGHSGATEITYRGRRIKVYGMESLNSV
jgi:hypothetical protein